MIDVKRGLFFLLCVAAPTVYAGPVTVTFLHTNDLHARVEPAKVGKGTYGGYARHLTLIRQLMKTERNPLLVNSGDTFQGTLYFNVYNGLADAVFMNLAGYRAAAVGNHEFDLGPAALAAYAQQVTFPLLSANIDVSAEPLLKDRVQPFTIVKVGRERIGLIGATTPDLPSIASPGPNVRMRDLDASLNGAVADLTKQGVDKIVLLSHLGYELEKSVATRIKGIDVILGAHSHTLLGEFNSPDFPKPEGAYPTVVRNPEGGNTLIATCWEWGKVFGRLKVDFDGRGRVRKWEGKPVPVDETVPPDPVAESAVTALRLPIENLRKSVVANVPGALNGSREVVRKSESTMANVLADAMLAKGRAAGATLAFINGGGVRSGIDAGPVTYEEAIAVQPFGNTLVLLDLTGAEILRALEHGVSGWEAGEGRLLHPSHGLAYTFDPAKPVGSRLVSATLDGVPLDPARTYTVVVNNFMASGGDGHTVFRDAKGKRLDTGLLDLDALVDYLKANPQLEAKPEGRIIRR